MCVRYIDSHVAHRSFWSCNMFSVRIFILFYFCFDFFFLPLSLNFPLDFSPSLANHVRLRLGMIQQRCRPHDGPIDHSWVHGHYCGPSGFFLVGSIVGFCKRWEVNDVIAFQYLIEEKNFESVQGSGKTTYCAARAARARACDYRSYENLTEVDNKHTLNIVYKWFMINLSFITSHVQSLCQIYNKNLARANARRHMANDLKKSWGKSRKLTWRCPQSQNLEEGREPNVILPYVNFGSKDLEQDPI